MKQNTIDELIEFLGQQLTPNKKSSIIYALNYRTRYVTVVLEDIIKSQNTSAVLRTCDCLGIQDVHIIENQYKYNINPKVAKGSTQWINLHRYNTSEFDNTSECFEKLKNNGYWLVATSPNFDGEFTIDTLPMDKKKAIIFGNEKTGLSSQAIQKADASLSIPMFGFTGSYNISVSVAIVLYTIISHLHKTSISWQLSLADKKALTLEWYRRTVDRSELIEKTFFQNKQLEVIGNLE